METLLTRGTFIFYQPTRRAFTLTSGSWFGTPARKEHPCLVYDSNPNTGVVVLKPLLGAVYNRDDGIWYPREGVITDYWLPSRHGSHGLAPHDSLCRVPARIEYDPQQFPNVGFVPKVSSIWCGDKGEIVHGLTFENSMVIPQLTMTEEEIREFKVLHSSQRRKPILD